MPLDAQDKQTVESLDARFTYNGKNGSPEHDRLSSMALAFAKEIVITCPSSPERATALSHLDAAAMFAHAAIARHPSE